MSRCWLECSLCVCLLDVRFGHFKNRFCSFCNRDKPFFDDIFGGNFFRAYALISIKYSIRPSLHRENPPMSPPFKPLIVRLYEHLTSKSLEATNLETTLLCVVLWVVSIGVQLAGEENVGYVVIWLRGVVVGWQGKNALFSTFPQDISSLLWKLFFFFFLDIAI